MINFVLNMTFNSFLIPGPLHLGFWQRLRAESCALRERGLAHGTWSNKVSHLRAYENFTIYFDVQDFPILLGVLLRFIALLSRGPLAYKSALNIISSLKFFTSVLDPPSLKVFDAVLVTASLKGLKAQLSRPVRQKLPFTVTHLLKFYSFLDLSCVSTWHVGVPCY